MRYTNENFQFDDNNNNDFVIVSIAASRLESRLLIRGHLPRTI